MMIAETQVDAGRQAAGVRRQVLVRGVNEKIRSLADGVDVEGEFDLVCECTNPGCFERLTLSLDDYEVLRRFPSRFAVKPGHVDADADRVVEEKQLFVVVEKVGPDAEDAIVDDPRRAYSRQRVGAA
jgi:hypothetical protein